MATAFCDRRGFIEIGRRAPRGCVPVGYGKPAALRQAIGGFGRLSYDGRTYIVPGVPEASDDNAAVEAVRRFCGWLAKTPGVTVPTIT